MNARAGRAIASVAVVLAYAYAGIDTRLTHHWQGPVFYSFPGFVFAQGFLNYPGGPADYLYAFITQAYASRTWGAVILTAQIAAATAVTAAYFRAIAAGRALPFLSWPAAALLLLHANLYYDRTPVCLAVVLGLASASAFVYVSRRWHSDLSLITVFAATAAANYWLGGMAIVFFAATAAVALTTRRPTRPLGIVCLLIAAAIPVASEQIRVRYVPSPASTWFASADLRRTVLLGALFAFYAIGTVLVERRASAPPAEAPQVRPSRQARKRGKAKVSFVRRPLPAALATLLWLLGLGGVAAVSYRLNGQDRRIATLGYYSFSEDWPAVIRVTEQVEPTDFGTLSGYSVNLALHQMNRLGDEMFRFPQAGPMVPPLEDSDSLQHMIDITDLCLRLGRINDAEHFGSEAVVLSGGDPRVYRLMARVYMVKGQTDAARKFLTLLTYNPNARGWAWQALAEIDRDPELAADADVQQLRRRRLGTCDTMTVWQRGPEADTERFLLDLLDQDPTNRMAFEFLVGSYLLARNLDGVAALMPRIRDMTGPAYVGPDGKRRTPRHYQEAMALFTSFTRKALTADGFDVQPDTIERVTDFSRILSRPSKEWARQEAWAGYRDTYFYYYFFGPGAAR